MIKETERHDMSMSMSMTTSMRYRYRYCYRYSTANFLVLNTLPYVES